jgi:hypothetical protein
MASIMLAAIIGAILASQASGQLSFASCTEADAMALVASCGDRMTALFVSTQMLEQSKALRCMHALPLECSSS